MALDMLKRSLQLLGGSTVSTGRNYFSNVASLIDDSKRIGSEMKDTISKPFEFIRKMTTGGSIGGGLYKYVNDWFYQRTSEFDSDDDDFDSGMGSSDTASGTSEKSSTELDSKAMKSIAHEQIGAMYQIGQKQVQAGLANTSEIVTTFNNRSTEIITSINNLNKSVMNIDKNLARLVAYGEAESERYNRENDTKNIFDGGTLTLGRVFEAAKTGASENTTWIMAKGYLDALKEGPSVITDTIVNNLIGNIKIGGKTLQEQAEGINEKIGNGIESFLLGVLKNDWFKKIFGNMGSFNTDLSAHIKYDYNKEKAVFDGMTRRTIIEIIPEYLKKITNALTGETWNIDPKKGKLTQNNVNLASIEMSKAMSENLFGNSALYASNDAKKAGEALANFSDVPSGVSAQILEWLSAGYIMAMGEKGRSASSYNNENGLMQDTGALLDMTRDKNNVGTGIGSRAIDIAWGIWKEKYGEQATLGIDGQSGFIKYCETLISKIVFAKGSLTADNFKKAIHRALQSAKSTGINLAQQGYDPHFHDITAMSKFIAENSINYEETSSKVEENISKRLEEINKLINTPEGKFNQGEAANVLLQYFGKSIDDFKDEKKKGFLSSSEQVNVEREVKRFIERTIREQETEKALEQDISSRIDTSGSFYAKGDKHQNIGSLVYDIKKLLEDGITVRVDKRGTRGSGGIPSKLNLNTHGCGPVALTDLANRMAMYGAYDPYYGTSVGDYISTAQSLGMNLRPGRATQRALMSASPTNPITVLGSGYGFGTETGQNHYMNIVGYNDGYVYTSNPMYGSGRFPVGAIANNSILGLFGRGTSDDIKAGINKAVDDLDQRISDIDPDSPTGKLVDLMHSVLDVRDARSYVGNPDKKKRRSVREKLDSAVDTGEEKYHSAKAKFTGIKDAIGGYFGAKKQAISDDTKEMLDVAIDNTRRRAQAIVKSEDYRKSTVSKMDSGGYSDKDKSLANQALSMMQTAVQDGDGASDLNAIKKVINKINNRELRSDLETNITTLINQSAKNTAKPKSKIGKFILFGFGLIKKLFSPVFKVGKVLLSTIGKAISGTWHAIKTYGPKILYWLAKPYVKGMARIKSGFKSIGRGIFGEKIKLQDGTVVRQRPTGNIFSNFSRTFKESKDMANEKLAKLDPNNPDKKKAIAQGDVSTIPGLVSTIISILRGEDPEAKKNETEQKKKDEAEAAAQGDQTGAQTDATDEAEQEEVSTEENSSEEEKSSGKKNRRKKKRQTNKKKKNKRKQRRANAGKSQEESASDTDTDTDDTELTETDESSETESTPEETPVPKSNNANNKQSTATVNKPKTGSGGPIAKILGGIASTLGGGINILMGIGQMALAAVAQLSGFRILINLVKKVFTTAIKPINKLFKQLVAALKPVLKTLTSSLTTIVDSLVKVVGTLLDAIIPFLEPLMNIVCDIMDSLGGILTDALTGIVKLLTPLVNGFLKVLLPLIKLAHGILETIAGGIMVGLGKVIYGIGYIIDALNIINSDVPTTMAASLMRTGNQLAESGKEKLYSGIARSIDAFESPVVTNSSEDNSQTTIDNSTTTINNSQTTYNQNAADRYGVDSTMSREAVASLHGEAVAAEIFGSGDSQASYGTFMNMNQHGCGPIALAENINRRNLRGVYGSGDIDPRSLTVSMYNAGLYNSSRGTSVADYLTASHALGYDMSVGGVNPRSLRQASPTNPITLIGSGTGFGTRSGNNHYINVIGNDGAGSAYVSNPLTGRISKASMSELTLNSKLGIYGSGDKKDESVSTAVDEALKKQVDDTTTGNAWGWSANDIPLAISTFGLLPAVKAIYNKLVPLSPDEQRIELEKELHSGKYSQEEANLMRKYLEAKLHGKEYVPTSADDSSQSSGSLNTMDVNSIDFSSEAIIDKYGPSTTVSSILGGRRNINNKILSMFTSEDTSTDEGKRKYLKRLKKEMGDTKYNILRAYAFLRFFKEYPPTGLESLDRGTVSGNTYAARFKMHEYDYITKYRQKVEENINNLPVLFPENELQALFNESTTDSFDILKRYKEAGIPGIAGYICSFIDGLSGVGAEATVEAMKVSASSMNPSNADYNNTTYTGADGYIYKAKGFTPRLTMPSTDNEYYKSGNKIGGWDAGGANQHPKLSMLANCSGYAYGRVHEAVGATSPLYYSKKNGIGRDGGNWIQLAQAHGYEVDLKGESPRPGDVISWKGGNNGGHVAIVEEVKDRDHIVIAHSAWNGFRGYSGDKLYFQTKELSRGSNASNPWQIWGNSWKFQGFARNPGLDYELANNGTPVSSQYGKIPYTDKMKRYMDNNGDQFAYNWTYNDTNANLFDKSNYHQSAVEAGLTPAEEAYVAGVGIMENGAGKLIGKKSITLVGHDALGSSNTGQCINDFGVNNWRSKQAPGTHDYTYGSTLTEQLKAGFQKNYFGKNPSGPPGDPGARKARNYDVYSGFLPGVIGHQLHLKKGDLWGDYLNTDLAEGTGVGYGSACIGQGWRTERPYARYAGAAIGYWNYMVDRGWVDSASRQQAAESAAAYNSEQYNPSSSYDPASQPTNPGTSESTASQNRDNRWIIAKMLTTGYDGNYDANLDSTAIRRVA